MKLTKKKKVLIAVVIVIVAAIIACACYIGNYYHAEDSTADYLTESIGGVTVTQDESGEWIFHPTEGNDSGNGLIFYPGGKVEATAYVPLMNALAQRGITCVLVKMPGNLAILDTNRADGIQERYPNVKNWYIGGHSLGGLCAAMYLSEHVNQYSGLLLLGAYSTKDFSDTDLSVLSIYGSEDGVMNRERYEKSKSNLPTGAVEVILDGGCHAGFGCYGVQKGDGEPTISASEQQNQTADLVAAWMNS